MAVLLCWVTQDFELYAAFDPLADKVASKDLQNLAFIPLVFVSIFAS